MESRSRTVEAVVWAVLAVVILGIAAAFFWTRFQAHPPSLPIYGQVQNFALTNQSGQVTTLESLRGKVWLANVIFTRCMGPCPKLSGIMAGLSRSLSAYPNMRFVTLTADPANDTREVLSQYARDFHAQPDRWFFLTGNKADIHQVAIDGLKLAVVEKELRDRTAPEDLFIHSTMIALVDEQGRMRGFFEALEPGVPDKIIAAAKALLQNPRKSPSTGYSAAPLSNEPSHSAAR